MENPHDRFFRGSFGEPAFVEDFLVSNVDRSITTALDLSTLRRVEGSFIDQDLRESRSDLLFEVTARDGRLAAFYLLFEHKSRPDPLTAFQILRYRVRINERRLREGRALAFVLPLVIYHGTRPWNAATDVSDLVSVPDGMDVWSMRSPYLLYDLSGVADDTIRGAALTQASLLLLKYIDREELPERLPKILTLIASLMSEPRGLECLRLVLNYVAAGSDRVDRETLRRTFIETIPSDTKTTPMPTIAEEWMAEGHQKGLEKGLEQGLEQGLEIGELVGQVRALERAAGLAVTDSEVLRDWEPERLRTRIDKLLDSIGRG